MKLSEAILLGDSLRTRSQHVYIDHTTNPPCGCAIGGATLAMGMAGKRDHEVLWPWLCECYTMKPRYNSYAEVIGFGAADVLGFADVCSGTCTLEELADWVRSVEPECGECNRFECVCGKQAVELAQQERTAV